MEHITLLSNYISYVVPLLTTRIVPIFYDTIFNDLSRKKSNDKNNI